jgi:predicted HTH domain antitoxin
MAIWQDLVSSHGFKRFVRQLRGTQTPPARVVILTAPGEESQVDYGTSPRVRDPLSGKYRRTRLFVMTLAYSRKAVRLLTFRSSSRGRILLAAERSKKGEASLGKAAELAGLPLGQMMMVLTEFGVESRLEKEDYLRGLQNLKKVW